MCNYLLLSIPLGEILNKTMYQKTKHKKLADPQLCFFRNIF